MIHDVIVVGSGPGGAIAAGSMASKLKAQGKSVLMVDRQPFPRDKVCGDGLPINVMAFLRERGIDPRAAGLEYQRVNALSITAPSGRTLVTHETAEDTFSMTARRMSFDHMLHEHALKSGADFEVMHIARPLKDGNRVVGVIERKGKTYIEHEAKLVIAADGATSALAREVVGGKPDPRATALGIRAYGTLKKPMPPCVYFYFTKELIPGYAWIFPIANGRANVGIYQHHHQQAQNEKSAGKSTGNQPEGKTLKTLLTSFLADIAGQFPLELDQETVRTWQLPFYTKHETRSVRGMLMVGDAGRFINAITGGGIYPAMLTGQAAAQSVLKLLAHSGSQPQTASEGADYAEYDRLWMQSTGGSLRRARLIQRYLASSAPLFNGVFGLASLPIVKAPLLRALSGEHY